MEIITDMIMKVMKKSNNNSDNNEEEKQTDITLQYAKKLN